jgi:hypothetical protein
MSGTQFCPTVVAAFQALFVRGQFSLERGNALVQSLSPETPES